MLKNILFCTLLTVLIGVSVIMGYNTLNSSRYNAPPVTKISSMCDVADGIAYRVIIQGIGVSDAVNIFMETRDLKRMGVEEIHFYINSPGGSLFDSFAIYDTIKRLNKEGIVTVAEIEGGCMSAAVLIAAACDYRLASENTNFMVHDPRSYNTTASDSDKQMLKDCTFRYANLLALNSDLTSEEWMEKMKFSTWFSSEEALEWGLIDEIK